MIIMEDIIAVVDEMKRDCCAFMNLQPEAVSIVIDDSRYPAEVDNATCTLYINGDWIAEQISLKHPMQIRSWIAYYLYGIAIYMQEGKVLPEYSSIKDKFFELTPEERNLFISGSTIGQAIAFLKGVPVYKDMDVPPILSEAQRTIKHQLNIDTIFQDGGTGSYNVAKYLSPAGDYKIYLDSVLRQSIDAAIAEGGKSREDRCGINGKGTKDNPFTNIHEAFDAIIKVEKEAIASDPYLNSDFIQSQFPPEIDGYELSSEFRAQYHYNVTWGLPQVAHLPNKFPDDHFIFSGVSPRMFELEFLRIFDASDPGLIQKFSLKPNMKNRMFLFRGQYKDFGKCVPNLHRDGVKETLADELKNIEMQCAIVNHPLSRLLGLDGVELFNERVRFQLNLKGLSQHYYSKTSCLDLTSDVEAAKFFAISDAKTDPVTGEDNYFVYHPENPDEPGVIYYYVVRQPQAFHPYGNNFRLSPMGKQYIFGRSGQQHGFLLDTPRGSDFMDSPYAHAVYFSHDPKISQDIFERADLGYKYYPKKDILRDFWKQIEAEWNTTQFRTISKKAFEYFCFLKRLDAMKAGKKSLTNDMWLRKLAACRIKVGPNKYPKFPREAISEFFQDMKNGWWNDEFTADVHFVGDEGVFMQRSFREIPLTAHYRDFETNYRKRNHID